MLEVVGLVKRYGETLALRGVDLRIDEGTMLALIGPNGAGKTTLLSIVAGLRSPDEGSVHIAGRDALRGAGDVRAIVGYASQELAVYPILTVRQNLAMFGELFGLRGKTLQNRIDAALGRFGLEPLADRLVARMSTGERRRVHVALAMLHEPRLLLLDEPTAGADVVARQQMLDLVRDAVRDGVAVCYSTHYLSEVEALTGATVAVLADGSIHTTGALDDIIRSHGTSAIVVTFDGEPPELHVDMPLRRDGATIIIETPEPGDAIGRVFHALGPASDQVRSVELLRPSLESVYLQLTGERFEDGEDQS